MSSGKAERSDGNGAVDILDVQLTRRRWLTAHTFELCFTRPPGLVFRPGQKVGFFHQACRRDYSLISASQDQELAICVRQVPQGRFSPLLAMAPMGSHFRIKPPFGFFTFQSSDRQAVFIATGTGIAPFVAFVRAGVRNFHLLHGVRLAEELYYQPELSQAALSYTACVSGEQRAGTAFAGRVTTYLEHHFKPGAYDFYLCGRAEMIRDATRLIDQRFSGSYVFSETFF